MISDTEKRNRRVFEPKTRYVLRDTMAYTESHFEAQIADLLRKSGVSFQEQPAVGGLRPDFLVMTPDGRKIVIEAKGWTSDPNHSRRAIEQAERYKQATQADEAYVVMAALQHGDPSNGLLAVSELAHLLTREQQRTRGEDRPAQKMLPQVEVPTIFAAMPFASTYDDVYFVAMAFAAKTVGAACVRVDQEDFEGDIVDEIERNIHASVAVIADLSESRPNVLYELGFAHARGKPTVPICRTPLQDLPFDVRNWNVIKYTAGGTYSLRESLARRLRAVIAKRTS